MNNDGYTRRDVLAVLCLGSLAAAGAFAQAARVPRVGMLGYTSAQRYAPQITAFRDGLRALGYVEGRNLNLELRWSNDDGDLLKANAQELIAAKCDVVVTSGNGSRAMFNATRTMPVVFAASGNPVADGYVKELARPGGNFTGGTFFGGEIVAKRVELLRQAMPRLSRVGLLINPLSSSHQRTVAQLPVDLKDAKLTFFPAPARKPEELEGAFKLMVQERVEGFIVLDESMLVGNLARISELATARKLPGVGPQAYADAGGLLGYGVDFPDMWRRAAGFVDRILKGASPATIPVEAATKFTLVANRQAATALGLSLPQEVLVRADHVI